MHTYKICLTKHLRRIPNARHFWFTLNLVFTVQYFKFSGLRCSPLNAALCFLDDHSLENSWSLSFCRKSSSIISSPKVSNALRVSNKKTNFLSSSDSFSVPIVFSSSNLSFLVFSEGFSSKHCSTVFSDKYRTV
ncbi:hypothetical protein FV767_24065 [Vibrio parahaemolyticus]|nr:hypothetical protein [Vibrio parahaemolyticus]